MTTSNRGPNYESGTDINPFPSYRIGCTFDKGLAASADGLLDTQKAIVAASATGAAEKWDVGLHDYVFLFNPDLAKGMPLPIASRSMGKTLAVANTANLPHGLTDSDINKMRNVFKYSDEEIDKVKRQKLRRAIVPLGVSQGNYYNQEGPNQSPLQDGIPVVIGGMSTVTTYFDKLPPLFADVTYDLVGNGPSNGSGSFRVASTSIAKVPLTFKAVDPRGTIDVMRRVGRDYAHRIGNGESRLPADFDVQEGNVNAQMLEDDKNAAVMTWGLLSMVQEVLALFEEEVFRTTTTGGRSILEMSAEDRAVLFGLQKIPVSGTTPQAREEMKKSSRAVVSAIMIRLLGKVEGDTKNGGSRVATKAGNAFTAFVGGLKDIDHAYGKGIGKFTRFQPSKHGRSDNGWRDGDIRLY